MVRMSEEAERVGMAINSDKTEVQYIGKSTEDVKVTINGKQLKQVNEFLLGWKNLDRW